MLHIMNYITYFAFFRIMLSCVFGFFAFFLNHLIITIIAVIIIVSLVFMGEEGYEDVGYATDKIVIIFDEEKLNGRDKTEVLIEIQGHLGDAFNHLIDNLSKSDSFEFDFGFGNNEFTDDIANIASEYCNDINQQIRNTTKDLDVDKSDLKIDCTRLNIRESESGSQIKNKSKHESN